MTSPPGSSRENMTGGSFSRTVATNDFAGLRKTIVELCTDSWAKKNDASNDGDQRGYG